ncbi:MAG: hypothetical protein MR519_08380 [Spirochaetaceae bacterium]|nr:hypothetical protein [Spirochaetaceae bacterium]
MKTYDALWAHIHACGIPRQTMTFDEIGAILGFPLDHSFLQHKKELQKYGYVVEKISLKARTVTFVGKEK